MRVLISPVGSHGDWLPFLRIGRRLQQRGHDVRLYGNGHFAGLCAAAGLPFIETTAAAWYEAALVDPRVTDPRQGMALIAEGAAAETQAALERMADDAAAPDALLLGSTLAFAPRLLAEHLGRPFVAAHLAPSAFREPWGLPRVLPGVDGRRWPRWLQRAAWGAIDRAMLDRCFAPALNRQRATLGLPPLRSVLGDWLHRGVATLGLFPVDFAPPSRPLPAGWWLTGFPLAADEAQQALPSDLQSFLAEGTPPVVFTAGTANRRSQRYYAEAAAACARLGLRGVLVAGSASQVPAALPAGVCHVRSAPFAALLPRAAAVVHHGGIGTLAESLRAGVPQLIRPMAYDQFDNAAWAVKLGVARELSPWGRRAGALDRALTAALGDTAWRQRCRDAVAPLTAADGVAAACAAIERAHATWPRRAALAGAPRS